MDKGAYILSFDVGTTGNKTCLYRIGKKIELVDSCLQEYPLMMTDGGGAEQRVDDWWSAICETSRTLLARAALDPSLIQGIAFCCQMQGSVLVDQKGEALRNPMIYMDGRATKQHAEFLLNGLFRIKSYNAFKLVRSLWITGGLAATPKDPLWKYHWVRQNEPEVFARVHKWLDVKDYLILRCTGRYAMTHDSAHATFLYDTRPGKLGWHRGLCRTFEVDMAHLPPIVGSTEVVGPLTSEAAKAMGLVSGTPVFGGGGDVALIAVGAGCLDPYDTHIYVGTSGWVVSNVHKRMVDIDNFIASILGAIPQRYNYVAEQETSGMCMQWVRDHLALDEIGIYLQEKRKLLGNGNGEQPLYELLNETVRQTPPGAGNVIFTPWLHGNRAPREDPYARSMFFNIGLDTGKRMLVRAVLEGVAYHKRWMLESIEQRIPRQESIRFVGGGAKSKVWCQIMADIMERSIEVVEDPQNAGAIGAAVVCAVGLGLLSSFSDAKRSIAVGERYQPRSQYHEIYNRNFEVFKALYEQNKKLFKRLNEAYA